MAEDWNLAECPDGERFLMNGSRTLIRLSRRAKTDLAKLMVEMEDHGVPLSYTEGLSEIYFTFLPDRRGDYVDDLIRLSPNDPDIHQVLVHELAHHIDEQEDVSGREEILVEKRERSQFIVDSYCRESGGEYVAVGFEVYYFGTREERRRLRVHNPVLFNAIKALHERYRAR